ncbi:hypothetical protein HELRODRAFT_84528, partial [Helobdella robusta]|uniref:G-protein coupled receptors family 2 profile 2 domain-containing protein n=1 Tax=Helobdella robusta TaxID=6412 RepID=T1G5J7_HELRO
CSYLQISDGLKGGEWMNDGCHLVSSNLTHTTCNCKHLTNFALLINVVPYDAYKLSPTHETALKVLTFIGCTISIITLALSFIIFSLVKSIQCERNTIHKNLSACLCLAEIGFLLAISSNNSYSLCKVIALMCHFLFLCSFSWMLMEGIQLYLMLIKVFQSKKSRIAWIYAVAYGVPTLIIIITASVNLNGYGTENFCWLSSETGMRWAFVGPAISVIVLNLFLLMMATYVMCRHSNSLSSNKDSTLKQISWWMKGLSTLIVLLGVTWLVGVFNMVGRSVFLTYVFVIVNSLQGLFIFIFHCLLNNKVGMGSRMVGWLVVWLVGLLVGWLAGWLVDFLVNLLVG